ncbi:oligogalacturonate lyase family protein [Asticcacaulis sp. BYS171W]|uniref:Oligogalacturonate lyase family protein n=1 Tax=Asticcacaulis aquaticus TaxID=2984212 RepID=A0ABT5HYE3_9CAUL|nr:oligogalacturonate lyase family protein [Asticcacaulis aquaticus]MDC7685106.1 oligogalacturonate lyase family protein [Asticcacaulis aquaticus]
MKLTIVTALCLSLGLSLALTSNGMASAQSFTKGPVPIIESGRPGVAITNASPKDAPVPAPASIPKEWIDKDTGHRVIRISDEAGSSSNYFNVNSYTPDGKWMVFSSPSGIMALDLKTFATKLIVPGKVALQFVGLKTGAVYYTTGLGGGAASQGTGAGTGLNPPKPTTGTAAPAPQRAPRAIMAYDFATGTSRQIAVLEPGYGIATINADETLFAGSRTTVANDRPPVQGPAGSVGTTRDPGDEVLPNGQKATFAEGREIQINRRLVQKIPMEIFTIDIKTGEKKTITASTDWLNHLQFSPTDPNVLLYCHEGNWHIVDRLWLVNVRDGSAPKKLHTRTMNMEIAGHEWWSLDGKTVWYDLQTPRGQVFWVAGYELATGKRTWYNLDRNEWGVHFNLSNDGTVFSSDGGDSEMAAHAPDGKYLYLLKPNYIPDVAGIHADNAGELIVPGAFVSEKLVNMKNHNYRSEPNASFTPDGKWLVFRSNMWGPGHVYAVETAKAKP